MQTSRVAIITVTYGDRWEFLSQVIESVIYDDHLEKFIIVDNASVNRISIDECAEKYKDKILVVRNEKNRGSAGGFNQALAKARDIECDFVLILDDDNVLEEDGIKNFLHDYTFFNDEKVVLAGYRDGPEGVGIFYEPRKFPSKIPTSFFNVFGYSQLKNFLSIIFNNKKKESRDVFNPRVQVESLAFGGSFMPIEAVKASPLPQSQLFLYGDDIEYFWGVRRAGYRLFACANPVIENVDLTFQEGESHLTGLFSEGTAEFKVYFRIRNMVLISMQHTRGFLKKIWLIINIFVWISGIHLIVLYKVCIKKIFFNRSLLVLKAVWNGLRGNIGLPKDIQLPKNSEVAPQ